MTKKDACLQKGYALISTLIVMVVIMALCSTLVAYAVYGRSLAKKVSASADRNAEIAQIGEEFVRNAESFGENLFDAYLSQGFVQDSPFSVAGTRNTFNVRVRREAEIALPVYEIGFSYCDAEGTEQVSLPESFVYGESVSDAARVFENDYTDTNGKLQRFEGWRCGGEFYENAQTLPEAREDAVYEAVYSPAAEYTLSWYDGQEISQTIYVDGKCLSEILPNAGNYRWFSAQTSDVSGTLTEACIGETYYDTLAAALADSEPGDRVALLRGPGAYEVNRAVTVDTNGYSANLAAADGYRMEQDANNESLFHFSAEAVSYIISQDGDGNSQEVEYHGSFSELAALCGAADFVSCYADAEHRTPGIGLLGDVNLTDDLSLAASIVPMGEIRINLNGHQLECTSQDSAFAVIDGSSLTLSSGSVRNAAGGNAVSVGGGKLVLRDVNVFGDLQLSGDGNLAMNGSSITGTVGAWGGGRMTVYGSTLNGSAVIGGEVSARFSQSTVTGTLTAESSVPAELEAVTGTAEGNYTSRDLSSGSFSEEEEITVPEVNRKTVYVPAETDKPLSGNVTLYAYPKSQCYVRFYDGAGKLTVTELCEPQQTLRTPTIRVDGVCISGWRSESSQTSHSCGSSLTVTGDSDWYPVSSGAPGTVQTAQTVSFTYYSYGNRLVTLEQEANNGGTIVLAYYSETGTEPSFFDTKDGRVTKNMDAYSTYCSAIKGTGSLPNTLFFAICAPQAPNWGEVSYTVSGRAAYQQHFSLSFTLDEQEITAQAPYGTELVLACYRVLPVQEQSTYEIHTYVTEQGSIAAGDYPDNETLCRKLTEMQAGEDYRGWYADKENNRLVVFLCTEEAPSWNKSFSFRVTEDASYRAGVAGRMIYLNPEGETRSISFGGIPGDAHIVYAYYSSADGAPTAADIDFFADATGTHLPGEAFADYSSKLSGTADSAGDGWAYIRGENLLFLYLQSDTELSWYTKEAEMFRETTTAYTAGALALQSKASPVYSGEETDVTYVLTVSYAISDAAILSVRVRLTEGGCQVVSWNQKK